jgi:hypothetical protein
MLYQAKLVTEELGVLADLIGNYLELITSDGWGIEIQSKDGTICVFPEEVATPDNEHDCAVVDRPRIELIYASRMQERPPIALRIGKVVSISILNVLAGFTPPTQVSATRLLGIEIPPGTAYGY